MSTIAQAAGQYQVATVVGLPLEVIEKLYNCAAFQGDHAVLGIVPKTYLPTKEYYEERFHFSTQMIVADFDVQRFIHERLKTGPGLVSAPQRAQATSFDGVDRLAVFRSRPAPAGSCLLPSLHDKAAFQN